jgi:hypothetical protein
LGLCIDTNDNLFVAQLRNKQVKKIKYLQWNYTSMNRKLYSSDSEINTSESKIKHQWN